MPNKGRAKVITEYKGLVILSGQIGNADAGFNEEVHQALNNVSAILKQAGRSMKKVLNVTVYLRNIQQIDEFNRFPGHGKIATRAFGNIEACFKRAS